MDKDERIVEVGANGEDLDEGGGGTAEADRYEPITEVGANGGGVDEGGQKSTFLLLYGVPSGKV